MFFIIVIISQLIVQLYESVTSCYHDDQILALLARTKVFTTREGYNTVLYIPLAASYV